LAIAVLATLKKHKEKSTFISQSQSGLSQIYCCLYLTVICLSLYHSKIKNCTFFTPLMMSWMGRNYLSWFSRVYVNQKVRETSPTKIQRNHFSDIFEIWLLGHFLKIKHKLLYVLSLPLKTCHWAFDDLFWLLKQCIPLWSVLF
jgi:hypothetical protein